MDIRRVVAAVRHEGEQQFPGLRRTVDRHCHLGLLHPTGRRRRPILAGHRLPGASCHTINRSPIHHPGPRMARRTARTRDLADDHGAVDADADPSTHLNVPDRHGHLQVSHARSSGPSTSVTGTKPGRGSAPPDDSEPTDHLQVGAQVASGSHGVGLLGS